MTADQSPAPGGSRGLRARPRARRTRRAVLCCAALGLSALLAAPAQGLKPRAYPTVLVSRSITGGIPNAAATNASISLDERTARIVAFESTATDLVADDRDGAVRDVFAVLRGGHYGSTGAENWEPGPTVLISRGKGGAPANGPSWGAAVSGWVKGAPHCIAFVSAASNLVRGDTNGVPDAFVYRWGSRIGHGRIERVSVDSRGRQADGPTSEVAIDGDCSHVAFTAAAPDLALTKTRNAHWRGGVSRKPHAGLREVYVRTLKKFEGGPKQLAGSTILASRAGRRPATGDCSEPRISHSIDRVVVYACDEQAGLDGAPSRGVYATSFLVRPAKSGPGGRYVVKTARVDAGGPPASHPSVNERGDALAYTLGTDAAQRVVYATRARSAWTGQPVGAASPASGATITTSGSWALFVADRPGPSVKGAADAGSHGAYIYTVADGRTTFVSYASGGRSAPQPISAAHVSAKGNYLVFETSGMDAAGLPSGPTPTLVYLHGMGGRGPND